jgi:hypothetical protein
MFLSLVTQNLEPTSAKSAPDAGILYRGNPPAIPKRRRVELQCQKCGSTDLRKVSLVYRDGLNQVKTATRLGGFVLGPNGPGLFFGRAKTRGIQQTDLSTALNPPARWSYIRLAGWAFAVSCAGLLAYIVFASASAPPVSTLPVKLYVFLAPVTFVVLVALFWRHNHLVYPRQDAEWDRSFLCQRCGTVTLQDI